MGAAGAEDVMERRRAMADCLENFVSSREWRGAISRFFHEHQRDAQEISAAARKLPFVSRQLQPRPVGRAFGGDKSAEDQEHAHEYHALFRKYAQVLEIELSRFLAKQGYVTPEEAFAELQGLPKNEQMRLVSIDVIEAGLDYTDFMRYMADYSQLYLTYTRPRARAGS
eukprot:Hpha_TRINITY_DN15482_c5_g2::TRINITY_DN15482_c5_g2_i1::g.172707::m.172707